MLYLDYILYIIIVILIYIIIKKEINAKEGFEHKGKGFVYTPKNIQSVIKTAVYGSFLNGPKDCIDVKPILDKLIESASYNYVVSQHNFGVDDPADGEKKYLIITFIDTSITAADANFKMPFSNPEQGWEIYNDGYVWVEGDSISLKFSSGEPNPAWFSLSKAVYKIAELFAYIVIRMPYSFINQVVEAGLKFIENFRDILAPIINFVDQMVEIARTIFRRLYNVAKDLFNQWLNIMRDIPAFLKDQFNQVISMLQLAVTKTFSFLKKIFDIVMIVLKALIKLPMMLFDILEQLTDVFVNVLLILLNIPTAALNMIIGMQNIMIDSMTKTPTIPFMDLFLK